MHAPEPVVTASKTPAPRAGAAPGGIGPGLVPVMSACTGLAVASQYYNQPMLGLIARDLAVGSGVSLVATATQVGYAAGIVLLVPLGDRFDRRRLILVQCVGLVLAMAAAAAAPGMWTLVAASVLVGIFATIAQQLVSFAAELAPPATQGRILGSMLSGLLVGVLLARTLSGLVAERFGWRAMFALGAVIAASMAAGLASSLPRSRPESAQSYPALLLSVSRLVRDEPALRTAALTQGLLFTGFSAFWTMLALLLQGPDFGMGSGAAGLFGLLGVGGVFIAPLAGGLADRRGPSGVVRLGCALVLAGFVLMAARVDLAALVLGVVVMDAGLQFAMVGNQSIIFGMAGSARGRFNTVFMTSLFGFGAAGSTVASVVWDLAGWRAVMAVGAGAALLALVVQFAGPRGPRSPAVAG